ncbi:MAG: hypothetical protein ACRBN8_33410 [Nannocystales bacterium]
MMLFASGCFGDYAPAEEGSQSTATPTSGGSSTTNLAGTDASSSGSPLLCEHVDLLILTDVSVSMAPFANGIVDVLLALGPEIEDTLAGVGTYRLALAYNAPPIVNQGAFSVPDEGEGCTQIGALVRGQDSCVEAFDGRPFLTDADDLGSGLTCLAEGVISGGVDAAYERPRILDSMLAILEADEDPALAACNEGFHQSPDPLVVIVIADADDESDATVLEAVTRAVSTQDTASLRNIGVFVIGADASQCPSEADNECGAQPACRVQEFVDRGLINTGLEGNVRRFNICRSLEDNVADVAASLLDQLSAVVVEACR